MKKKIKTKKDGKQFERFDDLFSKVVKVPKKEIEKREKAYQKKKERKKSPNLSSVSCHDVAC